MSAFHPRNDPHHHSRGDRALEVKRKRLRKAIRFLSSCTYMCAYRCANIRCDKS
nr:MAG TPA: hypothetical protein [Bacteriophage sp.]